MPAIIERRLTRAAGWSRRLGAFSFVLFATAVIAHRYQYLETSGLLWVLPVVAVLALVALLCGLFAFRRYWIYDDLGTGDLTIGILLALLTLTPFGISAFRYFTLPRLVDISTDRRVPPLLHDAQALRKPDMNPIAGPRSSAQQGLRQGLGEADPNDDPQMRAYPSVTGHRYDLPIEQVLEIVEVVAANEGWVVSPSSVQSEAEEEFTLEGEARSPVLGLPADFAIRATEVDNATEVDMRSVSRYGWHDLGDNAARIETFLADLDTEVARKSAGVAAAR